MGGSVKNIRRAIFWLHLTVGVTAGLIILALSVTGACLAFEAQIVGWAEKDLRIVTPQALGHARLGLDRLLANAQEGNSAPKPSSVTLYAQPAASVLVSLGRQHVVYLNPYTGETLGHGSRVRRLLKEIEDWHRWLGTSLEHRAAGRTVTGAANFAFLGLAVSGFYLWWPRNWSWRVLRPSLWFVGGLRGKARDWNWHNTIGVWCAPVLIVLTVTGVIMSYQWASNLLYTLSGNQPPAARESGQALHEMRDRRTADGPARPPLPSLDSLLATIKQETPNWKTATLRLPPNSKELVVSVTEENGAGPSFARLQLTFDSHTGEVVSRRPFGEQNLGSKLRTWARFLHTGEAGGIIGQTIAALASAGGAVLVVTGVAMACRRCFGRKSA